VVTVRSFNAVDHAGSNRINALVRVLTPTCGSPGSFNAVVVFVCGSLLLLVTVDYALDTTVCDLTFDIMMPTDRARYALSVLVAVWIAAYRFLPFRYPFGYAHLRTGVAASDCH